MSATMESPSLITTSLLVVSVIMPVFATASVALRFVARQKQTTGLHSDDWTIVLSLVMAWFISINTWVAGGIGGVNTAKIAPLDAARVFLRCTWIEGFPLGVGLAAIKISILLFYRRIFVLKNFQRWVNGFCIILVGWAISTVLVQLFVGDPISDAWKLGAHYRYNYAAFAMAFAGMSMVFDVVILCVPLPIIKGLHMEARRKITIAGIFWLGAFCCIAAAVRLYYLYQGLYKMTPAEAQGPNRFHNSTMFFLWSHVEPSCSILAACLPTYGPFFASGHFVSSLRSFFSLRSGGGNGKGSASADSNPSRPPPGKAWQMLHQSKNNTVEIAGGFADLEAQPMKIEVTRGFGSDFAST